MTEYTEKFIVTEPVISTDWRKQTVARNKYDVDEALGESFQIKHLKRLWPYLKPFSMPIFITIFLMLVSNGAMMIGPYLTRTAIDQSIPEKNITAVVALAGVFVVALLINSI